MSIIVIRKGLATRVPAAEFALESSMQAQIAANPSILPLHEIREGAELIAVVRELSVSAGYIDLLGFDAEGEIYVIETKLARNPDRRTVIAQAMDYGAALWSGYAEPAAFFAAVDEQLMRAGAPVLEECLRQALGGDEQAVARTRDRIAHNLGIGSFRFVVPMDRIGPGLKDLVRFINENSRFTVYLVELEQYQAEDVTVVVPKLFGAESRKSVGSSGTSPRGQGSAEEFLSDLDRRVAAGELEPGEADGVRQILRVVTDEPTRHNWASGAGGRVSVSPRFPASGATRSPFTLRSDGRLMLNRGYMEEVPVWRDWIEDVLRLLGRAGDSRKFPEIRSVDWLPHASAMLQGARDAARG